NPADCEELWVVLQRIRQAEIISDMRPSNLTEPSNCPILTNLVRPQTKPQATVASSNQPFRTPMILQRDPMGRVMNRLCNRLKRMEMALRRNPNVERARFEGNLRMTRTEDGRVICFRCNQPGHYRAVVSIITEEFAKEFGEIIYRPDTYEISLMSNQTIKIDKLLYATVSYDGTHTEVRFLVVKEFAFPALLGLDWCRRAEANINIGKCFEVTLGLDWIPIPKRNPQVICRLPETLASVHVTSNAGRRKQYNLKITGITRELNYDLIHPEDITKTIDNPTDRNRDVETNISANDEYDDFESVNNPVIMIPSPLTNLEDAYPPPRIDDILDLLSGSKYFKTLDLISGYWQIPLEDGDKEKTAFISPIGLYHFKVMPFSLCNAPATFQRLMNDVLRSYINRICVVYLDDIIVFSKTFDEHIQRLHKIFNALSEANLSFQPDKCEFCKTEINYLGHVISREGIQPDSDKISVVKNFLDPKKVRDVRSFLGLASY
ncbi:Retrovirus-related Pol polyprotein from transposon 17.6-like protein, partial [Dinothrombium tinctorium]